jgi:hypothetical protein
MKTTAPSPSRELYTAWGNNELPSLLVEHTITSLFPLSLDCRKRRCIGVRQFSLPRYTGRLRDPVAMRVVLHSLSALKMDTECSSETLVSYGVTTAIWTLNRKTWNLIYGKILLLKYSLKCFSQFHRAIKNYELYVSVGVFPVRIFFNYFSLCFLDIAQTFRTVAMLTIKKISHMV